MPNTIPAQIRRAFEREFWPIAGKFERFNLEQKDWRNRDLVTAARPGVYIWFDGEHDRVVKVGVSLVNARARALEHLRDNTGGSMAVLKDQPTSRMILFTLLEKDRHWAAALEDYLERSLEPQIRSQR